MTAKQETDTALPPPVQVRAAPLAIHLETIVKTQPSIQPGAASAKATRVRWGILAILFIVTTINYADRATISIAGPELKKLLGLSPVEMGFIFSAFAWSYVLAQLPGGWLLDRFGSKITYFFSIRSEERRVGKECPV